MCVGGQGQLTAESKRDQLLLNISKKPNELLKHFYVWIMFQKYLGCTAPQTRPANAKNIPSSYGKQLAWLQN